MVNVNLPPGTELGPDNLPFFTFETIGGNHSRVVFQRLLCEEEFCSDPACQSRPAIVYANLTDEEAILVGSKHNATTEFHLPTKFQDSVRRARSLLLKCVVSIKETEHAQGGEQFQASSDTCVG